MKRQYATKEADLCERLADVLRRDSWDVFHAVRVGTYEIDLVGVKTDEHGESRTLAVEAKMRQPFYLYDKALHWRDKSSYVAVLLPSIGQHGHFLRHFMWKHAQVGLYVGEREILPPIHTGAFAHEVSLLADAARKSSTGLLVRGGERSPRKARSADLLAEKVHDRWVMSGVATMELSAAIPDATPHERQAVVKLMNGKEGRKLGLRCRSFGTDYLVMPR